VTGTQRDLAAVYMDYLVAEKVRVHYEPVRPNPTRAIDTAAELFHAVTSAEGIYADCSGIIELVFHLIGAKSPSGPKYGWGYGNTQTMLDYLPHYTKLAGASVAAIVIFNADLAEDRQHATLVRHPGKDPMLFTHGTEADPSFARFSALKPAFPGTYEILNVAKL
jgi:hypothetical protein